MSERMADEEFNHLLKRDNCQFCRGIKGNVLGNENVHEGVVACDDCSILVTRITDQLRAECERLNKYIATHDEEYLAMKDVLRAEHEACQRMRQELEEARRGR